MATHVESFLYRFLVENGAFIRGMAQSTDAVKKSAKEIEKSTTSIRTAFSSLRDVAVAGAGVLFLKGTTDAARDLTNVMNTSTAVFGENAAAIEDWAEGSVDALGLSKRAAIEAATFIAGLGKEAGFADDQLVRFSTSIVGLAADLGAAFNTSTMDAIKAIQSGFSGSSIEPLRRYNIVLNDTALKNEYAAITGERVTDVLSAQQRMVAFLSLLYKKSADYVGQWAVESGTLLGAQQKLSAEYENFQASLGKAIVPALTEATKAARSLMTTIVGLDQSSGGLVSRLTVVGVAVGSLTPVLVKMGQAAKSAGGGLSTMGKAGVVAAVATVAIAGAMTLADSATRDATERAAAFDQSMRGLVDGTISAEEAFERYHEAMEPGQMEKEIRYLNDTTDAMLGLVGIGNNAGWGPLEDHFKETFGVGNEFLKQFIRTAEAGPEAAQKMLSVWDDTTLAEYNVTVAQLQAELNKVYDAQALALKAQEEFTQAQEDATGHIELNKDALSDYNKVLGDTASASEKAKDEIADMLATATGEFVHQEDPRILAAEMIVLLDERKAAFIELAEIEAEHGRDSAEFHAAEADYLKQEQGLRDNLAAQVEADIANRNDALNTDLQGLDLINAQVDAWEQLKLRPENVDLIPMIDEAIAEIEARRPQLAIQAAIAAGSMEAIKAVIDEYGGKQILLNMMIDAGATEESAQEALRRVPETAAVDIVLEGASKAETEGKLDDEEYVAKVTMEALTDELGPQVNEWNDTAAPEGVIKMNAATREATTQVDNWIDDQNAKRVIIPIRLGVSGGGGGGDDNDTGTATLMTPAAAATAVTALAEGEVTPMGAPIVDGKPVYGPINARAGQPIINVQNVYVTQPPGANPAEVISALRTWERRNGKVSGRG